jgi:hypothetical protein
MSEPDDRAEEADRAAARRDLRAAVRDGLVDERAQSDGERRAAKDARSAREAAAADRYAATHERAATDDSADTDGPGA